jgi:uncharacterized protein YidB (DUF937 family)
MSGLFKSKEETPKYETVYDPTAGIRGKLNTWMESKVGQPAEQYSGQIVAPASAQENQSFDFLRKYAGQDQSSTTKLGQEEIKKTLTGDYDPATSPYYQAVKATAQRNLDSQLSDIGSSASGAGGYRTGARMSLQNDARTDVTNNLNTLLGQMSEQERQNRLNVLPQAASYGQAEEQFPLQQATALQTLGALPRTLEQAQNEAAYNEWLRATQEYPIQISQLAQPYATQQPTMAQVGNSQSPFQQASGAISPISSLLQSIFSKK